MSDTEKFSTYLKCENNKVFQVIKFPSGNIVKIPISKTGDIKWIDDKIFM